MGNERRVRGRSGMSRRDVIRASAGMAALAAGHRWRLSVAGTGLRAADAIGIGSESALNDGPFGTTAAPLRIYLAPDDHTDYMWSADEEGYRRVFLDMLDYQLDLIDATSDLPWEHQAKWSCDGSLWVWEFERNRGADAFDRLIERIRDGHISVPLNPLVACPGGAPAEAILRGMYYAGRLERRHGIRLPLAIANENQTLPYGLGSLWAGAGAKYSWKGVCGCDSRVPDLRDRTHEIYWWVGPDGRRILMKWNSLLTENQGPGGYAEARHPEAAVKAVTEDAVGNGFRARYPYEVIGLFGRGWDDLETYGDETITAAIELTDETKTVIVSNTVDFFEAFEEEHGETLPRVSVSFGNEWDVLCASMQEVSARVRRSTDRLREAEALAVLETIADPEFTQADIGARDEAFMALGSYHEHEWDADGPVGHDPRRDWQRRTAERIETYVDSLHDRGRGALGARINDARWRVAGSPDPATGLAPRVYVFNPLGWSRDDLADIGWEDFGLSGEVHVVDVTSGEIVPSQRMRRAGVDVLRIWASNVPGIGYRVFEVRSGAGPDLASAASISDGVLVNDHYQVEVSENGTIDRLLDRARGNRDLVRELDARGLNALSPLPGGTGRVSVESEGPVSVTLRVDVDDPIKRTTWITLDRGGKRIGIENEIRETFDDTLTWDFGFSLTPFEAWHEEVGAVVLARLRDDGGHYSDRNARYDWLSMGHFAALADGARSITLSNRDCSFFKLGDSSAETLDTKTPRISALAGGRVDGPTLGIQGQGGDERFAYRFALRVNDTFSATESMRFALEHQTPFVTGLVRGDAADGPLWPADQFALASLSNPDVLLWALKVADDGPEHGLVVRLWNVSRTRAETEIALAPPHTIQDAEHVTHIETPIGPADIRDGVLNVRLEGGAMETFRVLPGRLQVGGGKAVALPFVGR